MRWDQAAAELEQHQRVRKANRLTPIADLDLEGNQWAALVCHRGGVLSGVR